MDSGTTVLRDIHGLDSIPWWPLAPGWWYLAALVVLALLFLGFRHWLIYNTGLLGWRGDARRQLRELKQSLASEDPQLIAGRLSELLRRIAMVRGGRREAASLTGDSWLIWLAQHDASGFDWERHGKILLTAPYMPPALSVEREQLAVLIRATYRWVDSSRPARKQTPLPQRLRGLLSGITGSRDRGTARV